MTHAPPGSPAVATATTGPGAVAATEARPSAPWIRAVPGALGIGALALSLVALAGWILGSDLVAAVGIGGGRMKANSAIGIAFLAAALIVLARRRRPTPLAAILAVVPLAIGLVTAVEYAAGVDLGIDAALFADPDPTTTFPGRMSILTATGIILAAISLLIVGTGRGTVVLSQGLAQAAFVVAAIVIIGFFYGIEELYRIGPYAAASLQGAIGLGAVAIGTMVLHPDAGAVRRLLDAGPGGTVMRAQLPAVILGPVLVGFLAVAAFRSGVVGADVAIALVVVVLALVLRAVLFRTARVVDATDVARGRAADEARRSADEARRLADEARRADERNQIVMRTISDSIVTIDGESRIRFANRAVERTFGYAQDELIGRPMTMLMPERFRPQHLAGLRRYIETRTRAIDWDGTELVGLRRNGEEFPIDVSFAEDTSGEADTFTGTIRDISGRKRLETQLLQAQRLESVGRLAGGIAHDFNNVLTAIGGFAQLLHDDIPPDGPAREKLTTILDATERASGLVHQLLAFSRQQILRPEVIELGEVVNGITPMLGRLIGEDVEVAVRPGDTWPVEADRGQIEQVIVNLVVNARDAMPGGGRLTIETANIDLDEEYVSSHPEVTAGPHVMLAVSDTGHGMDAATQASIFEPFFTTKDPGSGTGLGLATVYGIVRQSGGHIWVYSEPGKGTTFRLYFPRAERSAEPAAPRGDRPATATGRETILVTEDEESLRNLIRVVLGRLGYTVLVASDAAEAIGIGRTERIDLLVTDVIMPGRSGLELADELRRIVPDLRVLFMSGYTAAALEDQGRVRGDVALLEKPFSPDALGVAVRRALDGDARPGD